MRFWRRLFDVFFILVVLVQLVQLIEHGKRWSLAKHIAFRAHPETEDVVALHGAITIPGVFLAKAFVEPDADCTSTPRSSNVAVITGGLVTISAAV